MISTALSISTASSVSARLTVHVHDRASLAARRPLWDAYYQQKLPTRVLSLDPGWLRVLERGLRHTPYVVEALEGDEIRGVLPLAYVSSWLFGRYLVSLPYLNYGGVLADDETITARLIDSAAELAQALNVRYLELRHEQPTVHAALTHTRGDKVHMRLDLPDSADKLWKGLDSKVRNQVRKGQKSDLTVHWGGRGLLAEFYRVFSHNMRDLGTPVFSRRLFRAMLDEYPERAEICVVRAGARPAAAAIVLHGWGITEVPSASALRRYNAVCANMVLYWGLLQRAIERGQRTFDFGRSSQDSSTFRFKKQWGATPCAASWQYVVRAGDLSSARRDNPRYQKFIRLWQKLPVWLTRWLGPRIVRGIP